MTFYPFYDAVVVFANCNSPVQRRQFAILAWVLQTLIIAYGNRKTFKDTLQFMVEKLRCSTGTMDDIIYSYTGGDDPERKHRDLDEEYWIEILLKLKRGIWPVGFSPESSFFLFTGYHNKLELGYFCTDDHTRDLLAGVVSSRGLMSKFEIERDAKFLWVQMIRSEFPQAFGSVGASAMDDGVDAYVDILTAIASHYREFTKCTRCRRNACRIFNDDEGHIVSLCSFETDYLNKLSKKSGDLDLWDEIVSPDISAPLTYLMPYVSPKQEVKVTTVMSLHQFCKMYRNYKNVEEFMPDVPDFFERLL